MGGGIVQLNADERLHLAARIPVDREFQYLPLTSRYHQKPKWYQWKPRALLDRHWLKGLLPEIDQRKRRSLILADEGGVGKTKAAAYAVNRILSKNRYKPVLVVCPRRLIKTWGDELRGLMPNARDRIHAPPRGGSRTLLARPRRGHVYVISKHSLSMFFDEIAEGWKDRGTKFSLVVIDEAHQGKAEHTKANRDYEHYEDEDGDAAAKRRAKLRGTRLWRSMKRVCHEFSDRRLAVTASPLSLKISELRDLAEMIAVEPEFLEPFPVSLDDESEIDAFLVEWGKALEPVSELMKVEGSCDKDTIVDFMEEMIDRDEERLKFLPYKAEVEDVLSGAVGPMWLAQDSRREILSELNPLSPFVSATLRIDLGEEAEEIFRKRVSWTRHVRLHPEHERRLDDGHLIGGLQRYEQSWPTNRFGKGAGVKKIEEPRFDIRDDEKNGVGRDCPEPRIIALRDILRQDPVLDDPDNTEDRRGAVVFCNFLRTVTQVRKWLDGSKIEISDGKKVTIKAHELTGADADAHQRLNEIDRTKSALRGEYHVVIGTSAIQEGLDINWATTVVHWDLVSNPQMIEQRTWRLDRHRTDHHHDKFHVVYMVTETDSDAEMVRRISSRARLASMLLGGGRGFEEGAWPLPFDGSEGDSDWNEREYHGPPLSYRRDEDLDIASLYDPSIRAGGSPGRRIRLGQQKAIVAGMGRALSWGIDEALLYTDGAISSGDLADAGGKQASSLRRMLALADNSDVRTLRLMHPTPEGARRNSLRIDGVDPLAKGPKERRIAVSIDPAGALLQRLVRRLPETGGLVVGPDDANTAVVFSIDCADPMRDHRRELSRMPEALCKSTLFWTSGSLESGVWPLEDEEIRSGLVSRSVLVGELVPRMLSAIEDGSNVRGSDYLEGFADDVGRPLAEHLEVATEFILRGIAGELSDSIGQLREELRAKKQEINSLDEIGADRPEEVSRKFFLKRDSEEILLEIEDLEDWLVHFKQCGDGFYRPTLRYLEGGI